MNKKSLLMMMVTICLIAVVGVGATLAYLTDSTEVRVNTFTLGKTNIEIDEPDWEEPDAIVPGQGIVKDPTVTVKANSVDSYVFMSVNGVDDMIAAGFMLGEYTYDEDGNVIVDDNGNAVVINAINPLWVKADDSDTVDGIYVYSDANGDPAIVTKDTKDQELPALFEIVTYLATNEENDTESDETISYDLLVKAAAVQATGEDGYTYDDAYDAVAENLVDFSEANNTFVK